MKFKIGDNSVVNYNISSQNEVKYNTGITSSGISGVNDYEKLNNLPRINGVELIRNKTSEELKLQDEMLPLTNMDIRNLLGGN